MFLYQNIWKFWTQYQSLSNFSCLAQMGLSVITQLFDVKIAKQSRTSNIDALNRGSYSVELYMLFSVW